MIVRLLAVDPADETNIIVYQVPGGSRAQSLLEDAFNLMGVEVVIVEPRVKEPRIPATDPAHARLKSVGNKS